jgi:hypothetical protein
MITDKKMDRNTGIRQLSEFAQYTDITFWNNFPVFIPEIEHIANDKDLCGVIFNFVEEFNQQFLSFKTAGMIGCAEMEIGEKVDFFMMV